MIYHPLPILLCYYNRTAFRSQRTRHMEPSSLSLQSPDLSESAFKRALKTHLHVLDRPAQLRRLHDSGTAYKYPDLLTYKSYIMSFVMHHFCLRVQLLEKFSNWSENVVHMGPCVYANCQWSVLWLSRRVNNGAVFLGAVPSCRIPRRDLTTIPTGYWLRVVFNARLSWVAVVVRLSRVFSCLRRDDRQTRCQSCMTSLDGHHLARPHSQLNPSTPAEFWLKSVVSACRRVLFFIVFFFLLAAGVHGVQCVRNRRPGRCLYDCVHPRRNDMCWAIFLAGK